MKIRIIILVVVSLLFTGILSAGISGYIVWAEMSKGDTLSDYSFHLNKCDFEVHNIELDHCATFENAEEVGRLNPYAFTIIDSEDDLYDFLRHFSICSSYNYELENHSYLITYGAPAISAYYCTAYTLLLDDSPTYAKCWKNHKETLFVDVQSKDGCIYSTLDRIWDVYDKVFSLSDGNIYVFEYLKTVDLGQESD